MKIYFDQNITEKLYSNCSFSNNFFKQHQQFKSDTHLIITPHSLIELSGVKIKDCLKDKSEYNLDFSGNLLLKQGGKSEAFKALVYCKKNIRSDLFTFLENNLNERKQCVRTEHGYFILDSYLNSDKGKQEIPHGISCDRMSALLLERFRDKNTYLHIYDLATHFLAFNIPCFRLFIKSYKRLPPTNNQREKEFKKRLKELIETSDLGQYKDLVDLEMIQFAILGYDNTSVHFYTQDSADKIKKRLTLFHLLFKQVKSQTKTLLKNEMDILTSQEDISLEKMRRVSNLNLNFGKISIIDDFGEIKDTIDINESLFAKTWEEVMSRGRLTSKLAQKR